LKLSKNSARLASAIPDTVTAYAEDVKNSRFPDELHVIKSSRRQLEKTGKFSIPAEPDRADFP